MAELNTTKINGNISATGTVSGTNITTMQNEINELNDNLTQRLYTCNGFFLNGNNSVKGHGTITVNIMPNGIAKIDYFCKISSSGTSNTDWQWGINRDLIKAIIPDCPIITPLSGGYNVTYLADGTLYDMINGYGATHVASGQFWCFGRAYQINSSDDHYCDYGGWQEDLFTEGMRIIGTCYGKI